MDKEREQNIVVLKEDDSNGESRIANDVVAMLASIAATEVEGVSTAAGNFTKELMGKAGIKRVPKDVKVEIRNGVVKIELATGIKFGYNIPEISQKLQSRVKSAVENMTGLTCSNVNIRFVGVN